MADYNNLFQLDSTYKQLIISVVGEQTEFTNEDLYSEKFELYEGICAESELRFGECVASSVKFTISNTNVSLIGKTINVSISINEEEPFTIGTYIVDSDKPTSDKRYRNVVAYDVMYGIINKNVSAWYTTFFSGTGTKTLKQFRDSFFTEVGVQQVSLTLPQDNIVVEETIGGEDISGKTIINAICEINGCFGHINRSGQFDYVFLRPASRALYPSDTLYPGWGLKPAEGNVKDIDRSLYMAVEYEDYSVLPITKLQIRQSENDIGCIVGSGDNMYIVEDNILVYGKDSAELTTIATTLYNQIDNIIYIPASVKAKGNLTINVGDGIYLDTTYKEITTYVLERTLTGIQSLKDNFVSQGEEYQSENINSVNRSIIQLKGKTNELTRTIEETQSTIVDVERGLQSQITQNAEQILLKVSKGDVSSEISQEAGQITISSNRLVINSTNFSLAADGTINATNGTFSGQITANSGTIGGFTIKSNAIYNGISTWSGTGNGIYVGTDGINLGGKFKVNNQGAITSTSGEIGGFTIGTSALYNGTTSFASVAQGVYLGTDGINISGRFKVSNTGAVNIQPLATDPLYIGTVSARHTSIDQYGNIETGFSTYGSVRIISGASSSDEPSLVIKKTGSTTYNITTIKGDTIEVKDTYATQYKGSEIIVPNNSGATMWALYPTANASKKIITGNSSIVGLGIGLVDVYLGGTRIKFFASSMTGSGQTKIRVNNITDASTASTTAIASKVNELLTALRKYGLID